MSTEISGSEDDETNSNETSGEHPFNELTDVLEENPHEILSDENLARAVELRTNDKVKWSEFKGKVADTDVNTNEYSGYVGDKQDELERTDDESIDVGPDEVTKPDNPVRFQEAMNQVESDFGVSIRQIAEAITANIITLTIEDEKNCSFLFVEGNPSTEKGTVVGFFNEFEPIYRSDDLTKKSFVSHLAEQDVVGENDLLPKIAPGGVLATKDLGSWFSGTVEDVEEKWSVIADLGDGTGYVRDSGSQGGHGYDSTDPNDPNDSYRFAWVGATTHLSDRAWRMMGHVGPRVLMHHTPPETNQNEAYREMYERDSYGTRVERCTDKVSRMVRTEWDRLGGFEGVTDEIPIPENVGRKTIQVAFLISKARAPIDYDETGNPQPNTEGPERLTNMFNNISRAMALLRGHDEVTMQDFQVAARLGICSMPEKRRPIVRLLTHPF